LETLDASEAELGRKGGAKEDSDEVGTSGSSPMAMEQSKGVRLVKEVQKKLR
jgi:hypothetical protein